MIRLNDIVVKFGDFTALHNINVHVKEGEFFTFLGPSGCGKTTTLRTLTGFIEPVEGSVLANGKDITHVPIEERNIGIVFQSYALFPTMTVYDNIAFGPRTHGVHGKKQLDEVVETSLRNAAIWDEVKDRLNKSALGLSGGQQQRLCIARALAVNPDVLLMDEPTSALDPISTSKIEELALKLKERYSIVIVTHNMQQALRISDMTAFFLLGDMVEYDTTDKIFSTPRNKKTEDYITGRFG